MTKVTVDTEKLARSLERGIGDTRTIFSALPSRKRLRMTPCGPVSTAINAYAVREGIPSRLVLSSPKLPIDPLMEHVFPLLGESEDNPTVVDASPSQFLSYVGLTLAYEEATGEVLFPLEKIQSFTLAERQVIVSWLVDAARKFQKINTCPKGKYGLQLRDGPLANNSEEIMRKTYAQIWSSKNFRIWTPPARVQEDGRVASKYIPTGVITLS